MNARLRVSFLITVLLFSISAIADDRERAKRIHERLTGVPPSNDMLDRMEQAIAIDNAPVQAALYAIDGAPQVGSQLAVAATGNFYNVTLKNWVTPWTNEASSQFAPLNDYSATIIGMIRDNRDFREILYADILYIGNIPNIPDYSDSNNDHYEFLELSAANMGDSSVLQPTNQSSIDSSGVAGVITSRAAARAFFIDGTNRAMLRFTLLNHLCTDLEQLKDTSGPADRVRQDVSRSPGLDSTLFLNQCVGCHSGMDPLAQAFAYYEYDYPSADDRPELTQEQREELGRLIYTPGQVQAKYLINSNNFVQGYITPNDHWTNYWRVGENTAKIGWLNSAANSSSIDLAIDPAYSEGDGAASLGEELANTEAFATCQVKKAYITVCRHDPAPSDRATFESLISTFHSTHNMKQVFAEIAVACSDHL